MLYDIYPNLYFEQYEEKLLEALHIKYFKRLREFRVSKGVLSDSNEIIIVKPKKVVTDEYEYQSQDTTFSISKKGNSLTIKNGKVACVLTITSEGISLCINRNVKKIGDVSFNSYFHIAHYGEEVFLQGNFLSVINSGDCIGDVGIDGTMEGEIMCSDKYISYSVGCQSKSIPLRLDAFLNGLQLTIRLCFSQYPDIQHFFLTCYRALGELIYKEAIRTATPTETSPIGSLNFCPLSRPDV